MAASTYVSKDLRITVNGTVVTGRHVKFHGSTVLLDSPYRGFAVLRSSPGSGKSRLIFDKRPPSTVLKSLYEVIHFVAENIATIDRSERAMRHQIRLLVLDDGLEDDQGFGIEKAFLDEWLREGKIKEKQYKKDMMELRVRHSQYHEERARIIEQWWATAFPMPVDQGVRTQIESWLAVYRRSAVPIETNQN